MTRRRSAAAVAVAALAVTITACTSSTGGSPSTVPPSTAPVTSAPATAPTSAPVSTPVSTPTAPPTTPRHSPTKVHHPRPTPSTPPPATTSAPPPSTSTPPPPPPTSSAPSNSDACAADQLTASAVRGGAYQGREIAGIVFTNSSSTSCTVRGYPFAQLRYKGNPLGKPAKDDPGAVRTIRLAPGKSAQAQLTAVTTCQAPISDHVRVIAPDTVTPKDVPMQLRGCSLSIDPLEAG